MERRDTLGEWWKPHHEGERFASVAVYRGTAKRVPAALLVEPQPDVRDKPSKLDEHIWRLVAN